MDGGYRGALLEDLRRHVCVSIPRRKKRKYFSWYRGPHLQPPISGASIRWRCEDIHPFTGVEDTIQISIESAPAFLLRNLIFPYLLDPDQPSKFKPVLTILGTCANAYYVGGSECVGGTFDFSSQRETIIRLNEDSAPGCAYYNSYIRSIILVNLGEWTRRFKRGARRNYKIQR